jgi:hypothetical protein
MALETAIALKRILDESKQLDPPVVVDIPQLRRPTAPDLVPIDLLLTCHYHDGTDW